MGIFLFFSAANAAPFQNGNFETGISRPVGANDERIISNGSTDITGWTVELLTGSLSLKWIQRGSPLIASYPVGNLLIGCGSGTGSSARIYQIFDTIAGTTYTLRFENYSWSTDTTRKVLYRVKNSNGSGTTLVSATVDTPVNTLGIYSPTFVAQSSQTYLSFENPDSSSHRSSWIDNVTITPTSQTVQYAANYPFDPSHLRLKAIPGQDMVFDFTAVNTGGAHDANATDLKFSTSQHISFKVGSVTCESGRRTVQKAEGGELWQPSENFTTSGVASSGLSACSSGNITYSSTGGTGPWTYTPTGTYDDNVRGIRVKPTGTFASGLSTPKAYRVYWLGKIK